MNTTNIISLVIVLSCCTYNTHGQATFLEIFTPLFRLYRYTSFDLIGRSDNEWSYKWNLKRRVRYR